LMARKSAMARTYAVSRVRLPTRRTSVSSVTTEDRASRSRAAPTSSPPAPRNVMMLPTTTVFGGRGRGGRRTRDDGGVHGTDDSTTPADGSCAPGVATGAGEGAQGGGAAG